MNLFLIPLAFIIVVGTIFIFRKFMVKQDKNVIKIMKDIECFNKKELDKNKW